MSVSALPCEVIEGYRPDLHYCRTHHRRVDDEQGCGEPRLVIRMNSNADMSRGKYAAQAVHAALLLLDVHPGTPVIVLGANRATVEGQPVVVRDAGRTELEPGTVTAGARWEYRREPMSASSVRMTRPDEA